MEITREYQTTPEQDLELIGDQIDAGMRIATGVITSPEYTLEDKQLAGKALSAFMVNYIAFKKGLMVRHSPQELEKYDEFTQETLMDGNFPWNLTRNMYEKPLMDVIFRQLDADSRTSYSYRTGTFG